MNDKAQLKRYGIEVKEYRRGATGAVFIIIAILSGIAGGLLSEIGKDIWDLFKQYVRKRVKEIQKGKAPGPLGPKHKVYAIYAVTQVDDAPVVYVFYPDEGSADLDFDRDLLAQVETEMRLIAGQGASPGEALLGINPGNIGRGTFLRMLDSVPDSNSAMAEVVRESIVGREALEVEAHMLAGIRFEEMGRLDLAQKHYEIAAEIQPEVPSIRVNLGWVLAMQGDFERGLAEWNKAVDLDGRTDTLHYNIACYHACQGDVAATVRELELAFAHGYTDIEALEQDPDLAGVIEREEVQSLIRKMRGNPSGMDDPPG